MILIRELSLSRIHSPALTHKEVVGQASVEREVALGNSQVSPSKALEQDLAGRLF